MEIKCTVKEFAALLRACDDQRKLAMCGYCPLEKFCNGEGIEEFVRAEGIVPDQALEPQ